MYPIKTNNSFINEGIVRNILISNCKSLNLNLQNQIKGCLSSDATPVYRYIKVK